MSPTADAPEIQTLLAALALAAAAFDMRYRRIPNWLALSGFCCAVLLQGWLHGWRGLAQAGAGAGLAFGIYAVLFAMRVMGAGDVKLMIAIGAAVGPLNWLLVWLYASISGGLLAFALIVLRGTLLRTSTNVLFVLGELVRLRAPYHRRPEMDVGHARSVTLPHGVAIACGCLLLLYMERLGR